MISEENLEIIMICFLAIFAMIGIVHTMHVVTDWSISNFNESIENKNQTEDCVWRNETIGWKVVGNRNITCEYTEREHAPGLGDLVSCITEEEFNEICEGGISCHIGWKSWQKEHYSEEWTDVEKIYSDKEVCLPYHWTGDQDD